MHLNTMVHALIVVGLNGQPTTQILLFQKKMKKHKDFLILKLLRVRGAQMKILSQEVRDIDAVVRKAIADGHEVVNFDALTYASCLQNIAEVIDNPRYHFEHADIRDRASLDTALTNHEPDAIMHLAAESHVDRSIDAPGDFIETNITGTFNILEAARKYWQQRGNPETFRFQHISTDEVFGSLPNNPLIKFHEETPYDPHSPYSASKAASDHLVRAWQDTYSLPTILTNCSNNYGPFHFPEKLIPVVILNVSEQTDPCLWRRLQRIDRLFVEDHANALMLVLQKVK